MRLTQEFGGCPWLTFPYPILTVSFPKILTPTTTWTNLEDFMPSEINQSQKGKYCVTPLL